MSAADGQSSDQARKVSSGKRPHDLARRMHCLFESLQGTQQKLQGIMPQIMVQKLLQATVAGRLPTAFRHLLRQCPTEVREIVLDILESPRVDSDTQRKHVEATRGKTLGGRSGRERSSQKPPGRETKNYSEWFSSLDIDMHEAAG